MANIIIMPSCIIVPNQLIKPAINLKRLLAPYRLEYKGRIGPPKKLQLYKEGKDILIMPKGSIKFIVKNLTVETAQFYVTPCVPPFNDRLIEASKGLNLFKNSLLVVKYLRENIFKQALINNGLAGCVLIAPPGTGKTRISLAIAATCGYKTLFVTLNDILLKQAKDEILAMFGDRVKISYACGGQRDNSGDIILGIINTVINCPPDFFNPIGFTIIDEAHCYCSKEFGNIYWRAQRSCTLAMTATPNERIDKFDKSLELQVGKYVYVTQIPGFVSHESKFDGKVIVVEYEGPAEYTKLLLNEQLGVMSSDLMIKQLHEDQYRLQYIVELAAELFLSGRHIFIFVEQTAYGHKISSELTKILKTASVDDSDDCHIVIGGVKKEDLDRAFVKGKRGSIVITTYGYSKYGVNLPHMDTLIMATPKRTGMTQIIGRIFRSVGNSAIQRLIIDIVDVACGLRGRFDDRIKVYKSRNFEIAYECVNYTEIKK